MTQELSTLINEQTNANMRVAMCECMFVLYKITCAANGKVYIGQTNDFEHRIEQYADVPNINAKIIEDTSGFLTEEDEDYVPDDLNLDE